MSGADILIFRGRPEMGPAIVFGVIGLSMGAWTWQRWNRAAMITSLALGCCGPSNSLPMSSPGH